MRTDTELQHAVLLELSWEPSVTASHIGVAANAGVVTLTGHVDSFVQKQAAAAATRRVRGTLAVADEIEVRLSFETERSDDEIAAAAIERLSWDVSVPRDSVKVTVDQGWITLTGEVDWFFQKEAASNDVHRLHGVVGVSDQVSIKPKVDTERLGDDITHALHRSWFFDPKLVSVSAVGGKVRLTGTVRTPHDQREAAFTAWSAPGVTSVENDIIVA